MPAKQCALAMQSCHAQFPCHQRASMSTSVEEVGLERNSSVYQETGKFIYLSLTASDARAT